MVYKLPLSKSFHDNIYVIYYEQECNNFIWIKGSTYLLFCHIYLQYRHLYTNLQLFKTEIWNTASPIRLWKFHAAKPMLPSVSLETVECPLMKFIPVYYPIDKNILHLWIQTLIQIQLSCSPPVDPKQCWQWERNTSATDLVILDIRPRESQLEVDYTQHAITSISNHKTKCMNKYS